MHFEYKTKGTCSQRIIFDIDDRIVKNVQFLGGCNGNLQGIGALVDGMKIDDIEINPAYITSGLSVYTVALTIQSPELKKYKTHSEIIEALRSIDYVYHIEEMS